VQVIGNRRAFDLFFNSGKTTYNKSLKPRESQHTDYRRKRIFSVHFKPPNDFFVKAVMRFQSPVIVSGGRLVSSRQVVGLLPSSNLTIEIAPGAGQTR
jgi:hypothetical protein